MKCFAYLSHAARAETEASLADLARHCATLNARAGVTGVLTYADGRFAQLIEGPRDGVDDAIARINNSRRHRDITALGEAAIDARAFPDWPIQWLTAQDAADLERVVAARVLLPIQAELIGRIVLFLRCESGAGDGVRRLRPA